MDVLAQLVVWLNVAANALGTWLFAPIGAMSGLLSATLISVVTGVLLLVAYKYTSPQRAVKRVRDDISANLLALKLFKDSASVAVQAQGRLLIGAGRLLLLGLVPVLVMIVPVSLLLAQLSLWYQTRPLRVGEEATVTMTLNGDAEAVRHEVDLEPTVAVENIRGRPILGDRGKHELCWSIKPRQNGYQHLVFQVKGQRIEKDLAVGDGYMRVSNRRPSWSLWDALENPGEQPFGPGSTVQAIEIKPTAADPDRITWKIAGVEPWIVYWFVVSFVAGLCGSRVFNVNI